MTQLGAKSYFKVWNQKDLREISPYLIVLNLISVQDFCSLNCGVLKQWCSEILSVIKYELSETHEGVQHTTIQDGWHSRKELFQNAGCKVVF